MGNKKNIPSWQFLFLALPGIVYLIVNNYIPMMGIFNFSKGIFRSAWCGFDNFKFLFKTSDAILMTRNTILYNLAFIVLGTILAIFVAILMSELGESLKLKFFQSSLLLPNLLSWVVIAYICFAFLNSESGFINKTINRWLQIEPVSWYTEKQAWPGILIFVFLWKNAGYTSIVYLASISGIDKSVYEAADIDGASKFRQIFSITLPLLKPTVIIMTLMAVGRIFFSDFGLFYQVPMDSGALYSVTQTIDTYVYRGLMKLNDVGMSAAAGLFQSVVGFVVVMLANGIVRKTDSDNALF